MKAGASLRVAAGSALLACGLAGAPSRAELAEPAQEPTVEGAAQEISSESEAAADEAAGEPSAREMPGESEPRAEAHAVHDPWVTMNRATFAFNQYLDRWLLEPIATGWDFVVPHAGQEGIANFFENLATPRRVANDLLQGKLDKAGDDLGRFAINTTFGVLGFFDPATAHGIAPGDEDFGQTLGVWGVPAGPYLVLPFFGPSSPRDAAGLAVDFTVFTPEFFFVPWYVSTPLASTRVVNARSLALETVRAEREAAFDFYAAVRSAFVQYRANQLRDRADEPEGQNGDEDLYYLEDEDAEED